MKLILIIVIALIALIGILFLIGALLPRTHRASSRISLQKPPAEVWTVVRDPGALQGTWKELKSSRRLPDTSGKEIWEQNAGGFPMRIIIEESTPPTRLVTRIDAPADAAFGGTWTYELEPSGGGTRITVTENGYVSNPLFRVMMQALGVHRTADGYLRALGAKLGEAVQPVHVN